jgi:polyphenol oxidase
MIAQISLFKERKEIIHGSASKTFGDFSLSNKNCLKNQKKLLKKLKIDQFSLIQARQVHKNNIALISRPTSLMVGQADGLITLEKNLILGVRSADCLPIVYYEPQKKIVAIAHAGWRGILANLPQKMVNAIALLGGKINRTIVGIGPHIGPRCYSVGASVANQFAQKFPKPNLITHRGKKLFLNLASACQEQLENSGIKKNNLEISSICTSCQSQDWWSYRQKGKIRGNMLTVICQTDD